MSCFLVQTEKAYNLQEKGIFTIAFFNKNFSINKIELTKVLKKVGLDVLSISAASSQQKVKRRMAGKRTILQYRPKKYFVKVKTGQQINDETIKSINEKLNLPQLSTSNS